MSMSSPPEINASSMADIGFLLLIFFLVTTTLEVDLGIQKRLPNKEAIGQVFTTENNTLEILINNKNEIMVDGVVITDLMELKKMAIDFIDNGAGLDAKGNPCTWCNGNKNSQSSDHPKKAIVKLLASRDANYDLYIKVQNTISSAYNSLRNRLALTMHNDSFTNLKISFKKNQNDDKLESYINAIEAKYPIQIVETTYRNIPQ